MVAVLEDLEAVDEEWAELGCSTSKREDGTWRMNGWDEEMVAPPPSAIWNPPIKKERESEDGEAPESPFAEDKPSPPPEITDEINFEPPPNNEKKSLRSKWTTVGHAVPPAIHLSSVRQVQNPKSFDDNGAVELNAFDAVD